MNIIIKFLISLILFIYGLQLFSKGIQNTLKNRVKKYLIKYTNTPLKGIFLGTILTSIFQSSTLTTILTISLVNTGIISFKNSLGIMMGANLGTCITSWLTAFLNNNTTLIFLNPYTYVPLLILLSFMSFLKKQNNKSYIFLGFAIFMLGFKMLQTSLIPIQEYNWFKTLINTLNNPILAILSGILITTLIQSSSATVAILQNLSLNGNITYLNSIPLIMGENIGTCTTTLIATFKTTKEAKKVALSHLLYNILGTIFFLIIFYILYFFKIKFLNKQVNSLEIAIIHTLFNFLSIIIFYPFLKQFEKLINKLLK